NTRREVAWVPIGNSNSVRSVNTRPSQPTPATGVAIDSGSVVGDRLDTASAIEAGGTAPVTAWKVVPNHGSEVAVSVCVPIDPAQAVPALVTLAGQLDTNSASATAVTMRRLPSRSIDNSWQRVSAIDVHAAPELRNSWLLTPDVVLRPSPPTTRPPVGSSASAVGKPAFGSDTP